MIETNEKAVFLDIKRVIKIKFLSNGNCCFNIGPRKQANKRFRFQTNEERFRKVK